MAVSEATTKGVQSVALNEGRYRTLVPLAVLLVGFLLIQTFLFIIHPVPTARTETDGIFYMYSSTGPLFLYSQYWGPGYPWAIRLFSLLTQSPFASAKLVSILSGILFITCTYLIALRFGGVRLALITGIFITLNSNTITWSSAIMSDIAGASLFMLSMALIIVPDEVSPWFMLFSGAIAGLAYLTRYAYVILLAMPLLYLVMRSDWRKHILHTVLFYIAFILIISPWTIFVWIDKGNPFYSQDHYNLLEKYIDQLNFPDPHRQFSGILEIIFAYPRTFVKSMVQSFLKMPTDVLSSISSVGFVGAMGSFLWLKELDRRKALFLILNLLYIAILFFIVMAQRYLMPLAPMVSLFVATAVIAIPERIRAVDFPGALSRLIDRIPFRRSVLGLLVIFMLAFMVSDVARYYSELAPEYVTAGEQLKAIAPKDAVVIGWRPHIAYFAGLNFDWIIPEDNDIKEVMDLIEKSGADYFAIDERYTTTAFPQYAVLLDPNNPYKDKLRPVVTIDSPKKVIIYQYLRNSVPHS